MIELNGEYGSASSTVGALTLRGERLSCPWSGAYPFIMPSERIVVGGIESHFGGGRWVIVRGRGRVGLNRGDCRAAAARHPKLHLSLSTHAETHKVQLTEHNNDLQFNCPPHSAFTWHTGRQIYGIRNPP